MFAAIPWIGDHRRLDRLVSHGEGSLDYLALTACDLLQTDGLDHRRAERIQAERLAVLHRIRHAAGITIGADGIPQLHPQSINRPAAETNDDGIVKQIAGELQPRLFFRRFCPLRPN
jgi:hypothetical protein